jgi:serpin B
MPMISVRRVGRLFVAMAALAPCVGAVARADDLAPLRELTAAYNASGHDLFVKFAATPGNIVFSPYSIGTAMAMALAGARHETEGEMRAVLRHTLPRGAIDAANAGVLAVLDSYDKSGEPRCPAGGRLVVTFGGTVICEVPLAPNDDCPGGSRDGSRIRRNGQNCSVRLPRPGSTQLRTANALMLLKGRRDVISGDYARLITDKYQAEVFRDADLDAVNRWVSQRTEGKIDRILDRLDPRDEAVILDAVYFKAAWREPFRGTETKDRDFNLTTTSTVKVAMMQRGGRYPLLVRPGYRALRLPYGVDALSMVIVLPDDIAGATALARDLDAVTLAGLFKELNDDQQNVQLALPRFTASFKASLKPLFVKAGMTRAFDWGQADFSGMSGRPRSEVRLAIDDIEHRAVIGVGEEGTEAAAATAVSMRVLSLIVPQSNSVPFVVDRPFLFYIVDGATDAILFEGRISDPRAQ